MATSLNNQTAQSSTTVINDNNTQTNYANVLKKGKSRSYAPTKIPTKEEAIVFPISNDSTNENYAEALLDTLQPDQIRFVSRMSNARLCVYLDSKQTVDHFMQHKGCITINNVRLNARRLLNPAKKLVLSNVGPNIPNDVIEAALRSLGLQLNSPIIYLNAGFSNGVLKHVLSFRRSVYYNCPPNEEELNIPSSIQIEYEDERSRIFLSTEQTIQCFLCKETGHLAKNCTSTPQTESANILENDFKSTQESNFSTQNSEIVHENSAQNLENNLKRDNPPSSTGSQVDNNEINQIPTSIKLPKAKRQKTETKPPKPLQLTEEESTNIKQQIEAIRNTEIKPCPFTADAFLEFLPLLRTKDKIQHAKKLTPDLNTISSIMEEIKPLVLASTKRTLTAFQKTITSDPPSQDNDTDDQDSN